MFLKLEISFQWTTSPLYSLLIKEGVEGANSCSLIWGGTERTEITRPPSSLAVSVFGPQPPKVKPGKRMAFTNRELKTKNTLEECRAALSCSLNHSCLLVAGNRARPKEHNEPWSLSLLALEIRL
jgi:hypothetical protein